MAVRTFFGRLRKRYMAEFITVRIQWRRSRLGDDGNIIVATSGTTTVGAVGTARGAATGASVAETVFYTDDSASPMTVNKPAAFAAGQMLVFIIADDSGVLADLTTPSGWTQIAQTVDITGQRAKAFWHVYSAGDPASWDFGYNSGAAAAGVLLRIVGADVTTPTLVAATGNSGSNGATLDSPTVTPTGVDDLLVVALTSSGGGATFSYNEPTGTTDYGSTQVAGGFQAIGVASEQLFSGGATGARTWTSISPTARQVGSFSIAIKSADTAAVAETGTGTAGVVGRATAVRVAAVSARTTAGAVGHAAGGKRAAEVGTSTAGAAGAGAVRKVAPSAGRTTVGATSTGVAVRLFYRDGTAGNASGALVLTIPATAVVGDQMWIASVYKTTVATGTVNTPAGWTLFAGPVDLTGSSGNGALFTRTVQAGDAGSTVTLTPSSGTQQLDAVLVVIAGAAATPRSWGWADQGVTASTAVPVTAQTAVAGDLILLLGVVRGSTNGTVTFTAPANYTMRQQATATSGVAQDVAAFAADGGVSGTQTVTASRAVWAITGQIVLQPNVAAAVGESGTTPAGLASTAAAVKVASVAAVCGLGATAAGVAARRAAAVGATPAGLASSTAVGKKSAAAGTATAGLVARAATVKRALPVGVGTVGAAGAGAVGKKTPTAGTIAAGATSRATAGRKVPQAATTPAGAASTAAAARVVAVAGTSRLGAATAGAVALRRAAPAATAAAGLTSTGGARKQAADVARTTAGLASTGVARRLALGGGGRTAFGLFTTSTLSSLEARPQTGTATAGVHGRAAVTKVARPAATTPAGAAGSGTTGVVRIVTGRTTAGIVARGTAARSAPAAGRTPVGVTSRGTAVRKAPAAGTATAGMVSTAAGRKVTSAVSTGAVGAVGRSGALTRTAAQAGRAAVGAATSGTATHRATTTTGRTATGAVGRGTAARTTASTGRACFGAATFGTASASDAIPATGTSIVGVSSRATVARKAGPAGRTAVGAVGRATAVRIVAVVGRCTAGTTSRGAASKRAAESTRTTAGLATSSTARKTTAVAGTAAVGCASIAAAKKRGLGVATAPVGLTSAGRAARTVTATATTGTGISSHGNTAGMRPTAGTAAVGLAASGTAGRVATATGVTALGVATAGTATIPPPPPISSPLYAAAAALLECVRAALAATPAGQPARVCVVAGALAWDECDCGLLAATVTRVYPTRTFPTDASGQSDPACPPGLAADLTVTVLRCAPSPDRFGNPPTCDQFAAAAAVWRADAYATLAATVCCLPEMLDNNLIDGYTVRDVIPVGPEGGCVGFEHHVTIGLCDPLACG